MFLRKKHERIFKNRISGLFRGICDLLRICIKVARYFMEKYALHLQSDNTASQIIEVPWNMKSDRFLIRAILDNKMKVGSHRFYLVCNLERRSSLM